MPLGIIPELEAECLPRPGELVVQWVSRNTRTAGASPELGADMSKARVGGFDDFALRYCGPWAPRLPLGDLYVGDLVVALRA